MPSNEDAQYMLSFDVEKEYYHLDLAPELQKYFGFSFKVGREKYYGYYTVVPFGISMAPNLLCKMLKPFVAK